MDTAFCVQKSGQKIIKVSSAPSFQDFGLLRFPSSRIWQLLTSHILQSQGARTVFTHTRQ